MTLNFNHFNPACQKTDFRPPEDASEQAEESATLEKYECPKPRILVYSPDDDVRYLFKTILEIWDFDVIEADNFGNSVAAAQNNHLDLVLMDTEHAFSESFSKMRKMKKSGWFKEIPFVLISGHAQEDIRLMALAAGADDFLVKPVNLALLEIILKSRLKNDDPPIVSN